MNIAAFVTSERGKEKQLNGYDIICVDDLSGVLLDHCAFFIATNSIFHIQICNKLEAIRTTHVFFINRC